MMILHAGHKFIYVGKDLRWKIPKAKKFRDEVKL